MKKRVLKPVICLFLMLAIAFGSLAAANVLQHGSGSIEIRDGSVEAEGRVIPYKLYVPRTATKDSPAPGVLLLHGYQNDHETNAAFAIELARRGAVVMSIDEYGHGSNPTGMLARGYVNHMVKVNYGNDSEEDGTYRPMSGPSRYKLLSNFSNLSFFDPYYSEDDAGNSIADSSMGGCIAYKALSEMDFVDPTRLGLSGHSMGTWSSWSVAAAFSGMKDGQGRNISPKATVLQCGELFRESVYDADRIHFSNVLLLQAKYDEFSYFRDYKWNVTDELLKSDLRTSFLGTTAEEAKWNTTYGSFEDGTARRIELLWTNHRLTTHNAEGIAVSMDWFDSALTLPDKLNGSDQTAMIKEWLVFAAMLLTLFAMLPLMDLLIMIPFFAKVRQPLPPAENVKTGGKWARGCVITILIAGLTYPFMTQLGQGLLPLPENIFRMTIGNGFLSWYSLLIIIMIVLTVIGNRKAKKKGHPVTWHDMGLGRAEGGKMAWGLLGRGAVLALCMVGLVYLVTGLSQIFFDLDLRFIWPFFKVFSGERFLQFLLYFPVFALFYILNNSKIFASMRTKATYREGPGGFWSCWLRYALLMVGGTLLVILIEYIPFFLGIGPGADVLFGSTFGGPFMSLLIVFAPQVIVFSLLGTYIYRKTGNVYTGALTIAAVACWIVTGGSAIL
ncbi:MAG: hypothetical protein IJU57_00045 [Clostridia bacterium]|nr:hypothetical protein [Clostridia bacterium]